MVLGFDCFLYFPYNLWLGLYLFVFQLAIVIASETGQGWISNLVGMEETQQKGRSI
jgi:hypothetical protein